MSSNTVTDKIKAVAGSADSGFTNNLANVIEKYNDLALKYKSERSKNKDLANQVNTLTTEVEKLRVEIASYHSLMNFAVDNVDLDSDEENEPQSQPQEQPKAASVQPKTPQLVDLESESEEEDSKDESEEESQEEDPQPVKKVLTKPVSKAPVKPVRK